EPPTAGKRPATSLGCNAMASIPAPVSLPGPLSWWHNPKTRRRVIAVAVLVAAYGLGLTYGAWTRVCAGDHGPSISRLVATPDHHDAAGPQHLSGRHQPREDAHAQAQGGARGRGDRAQLPQGHDPPALPEPDQPGGGGTRRGGGGADLLREAGAPAQCRRGRDA